MRRHRKKPRGDQRDLARHVCLLPSHPESKSSVDPHSLTDQEFEEMMLEFDQASAWMLDQLKLKRTDEKMV